MQRILVSLLALALGGCAATDTNLYGRMVVQSSYTAPTCATATAEGDLCVADAIEANGALDVAGASTLTGATTITGAATLSSTLGVAGLTTATGGVYTTKPLFLLEDYHFCGQGANGTTATYIGPNLPHRQDDMSTYKFGGAGCDGLDNTTEATADAPIEYAGAIKVVGMACTITDGGTDDVYTFQARDDTADIAGVTCSITLDGAGTDTCSVILAAPVTVAAGSALAIKQVADTDDNCSACDTECFLYFTR